MYIIIGFALVGAIAGARVARRRGGNRLDAAQYAAVFAIFFALIALGLVMLAGWFLV